jgi:hypothetical protein
MKLRQLLVSRIPPPDFGAGGGGAAVVGGAPAGGAFAAEGGPFLALAGTSRGFGRCGVAGGAKPAARVVGAALAVATAVADAGGAVVVISVGAGRGVDALAVGAAVEEDPPADSPDASWGRAYLNATSPAPARTARPATTAAAIAPPCACDFFGAPVDPLHPAVVPTPTTGARTGVATPTYGEAIEARD